MGKITYRQDFPIFVTALGTALSSLLCVAIPGSAAAQSVDVDLALEQAVTTVDDMGTPTGYRVGIAIPRLLGAVGLEVSYRTVREHLGEQALRCGFDMCTPGPFDTAMVMRAVAMGLGWSMMLNPFVEMSTGVTASVNWQDHEYRPGPGADQELDAFGTETTGPDAGLGVFASWRFPPLLSVLSPFLFTRAEWVRAGACPADAACFGHRYVGSAGIGMYARIP